MARRDRIEKLRRLAESPNEHEAASARAEIARLLGNGGGADLAAANPELMYLGTTAAGVRQYQQAPVPTPAPSGQLPFVLKHPRSLRGGRQ